MSVEELTPSEWLQFRERVPPDGSRNAPHAALRSRWGVLEIDMGPFNRDVPKMRLPRSIGQGVTFLNRCALCFAARRLLRGDGDLSWFVIHVLNDMYVELDVFGRYVRQQVRQRLASNANAIARCCSGLQKPKVGRRIPAVL